jgi:hypothetical protein
LTLTRNGDQITVATGEAIFVLGGDPGALFDEIRLADGTRVAGGSALTARANETDLTHPTRRRLVVEHAGPLTAIVVEEGAYNLAPVGDGGLGSRRRYVFTAGSATAIVRHAVNWEGAISWEGTPCEYIRVCDSDGDGDLDVNGLSVQRVRDDLALDLTGPLDVTAVGAFAAPAVEGTVAEGEEASVRQRLRVSQTAPLAFEVGVPSATGATGDKADGGMLAVTGASGTVAVALNRMHRYEPQALRLLPDGRLAVDLVDDQVWLSYRQGLFATLGVSALPERPARADLDRLLWAPLNQPLHAWASPEWFAASDAVEEFPVGPLPDHLAGYDALVPAALEATVRGIDADGLSGLMTFGSHLRYPGELDCEEGEVHPDEAAHAYWCGTWTDYHNTIATAPIWAMRSGEVQWLDEIAFPGALRMLHTQIIQCAPEDTWFYCGQAPAGYGAYREDFNSSHAYFDNLFLYYWLTGDFSVVETVQRGATSFRQYLCFQRPAAPCSPTDEPIGAAAGRPASQWYAAFRFLGLASDDPSYLDDYRGGLARVVTQHYVEAEQDGTRYGFMLDEGVPVAGPGTYVSHQLWMASLYDTRILDRLRRDTDDAPIGDPAIPPSQVMATWARTLVRFGATISGDGTAEGQWPNALSFTWSGERIGGTLEDVSAYTGGADDLYLWDTGKAALTAVLVQAGLLTGDDALIRMGEDLTVRTIEIVAASGLPLGKEMGIYLTRLHAAVARLAEATPPPPATEEPVPAPTTSPVPQPTASPSGAAETETDGILLQSSLDDAAAIESPAIGAGGTTTLAAADFVAGQTGAAVDLTRPGQLVRFPTRAGDARNVDWNRGQVEFWYRPEADAAPFGDGPQQVLFAVGNVDNVPHLMLVHFWDGLRLIVTPSWEASFSVGTAPAAPLWRAGEWIKVRAAWDSGNATDSLQIYLNDVRVDEGGAAGGWDFGEPPEELGILIGSGNANGDFPAMGAIDELRIWDTPEPPAAPAAPATPESAPPPATPEAEAPPPTETAAPQATATGGSSVLTDPSIAAPIPPLDRPAAGVPFTDPVFGSTIRRVSDRSETDPGGFEVQTYSQLQAFSADNEYILVLGSGDSWYFVRRVADFSIVEGLEIQNAPRWHPTREHVIVHVDTNFDEDVNILFTDVDTGVTTEVATLPNLVRIENEASFEELSHDGRWLAGMGTLADGTLVAFSWDLIANAYGAYIPVSDLYASVCTPDPEWGEILPDAITPSPLGNFLVLSWGKEATTRCSGTETFDIGTGEYIGHVQDTRAHADLGVAPDGREFLMLYSGSQVVTYWLPGGETAAAPTLVFEMGDWIGEHISCQGLPGVCLLSTRDEPANGQWLPLEGELILLSLDGSIRRLAHHRSSICGYWSQPRATISRDGTLVAYSSDWGFAGCTADNDVGTADPYILEVPAGNGVDAGG